jgi:hypothetical protein
MTYYDWQITHTEVMSSDNPDKQGLQYTRGTLSQFSIGIHRIPVELPHSTDLELRKLRRTRTDSDRASSLELL